MEVVAEDHFVRAAASALHCFHCFVELRVSEHVGRGGAGAQAARRFELLAAVDELECLAFPNWIFSAKSLKGSVI